MRLHGGRMNVLSCGKALRLAARVQELSACRWRFSPIARALLLLRQHLGGRRGYLYRLARLANRSDRLAHGDRFTLRGQDLQKGSRSEGLYLNIDLVGFDLRDRLALLHLIALVFDPAQDLPLGHVIPHLGHQHVCGRHQTPPRRSRGPGVRCRVSGVGSRSLAPDTWPPTPDYFFTSLRTASTTSCSSGNTSLSSFRLYGTGTSKEATRDT